MKKILTTLALAAVIIFAGCTDLDDVYRQLDEQEKELATVRTLLNAMTNKVSVVSYKELPDGSGYELTMSDGTKITLKHGAKGNQGERGVKGQQGEDGQDASADLTITETDDTVIIVYKGVTYTISKSVPLPSMTLPSMTFTTAKAPGGKLRLLIAAAEVDRADVWIDLNNNGNEDEGEKVTRFSQIANYPFTNQTITIYGKVSELICFGNELTALDVSNNAELVSLLCMKNRLTELNVINNTKLRQLQCYENQISGDKMTELVNSLPDRTGKEKGIFRMINLDTPEEGNSITTSDAAIATGKNWSVEDAYASPYTPPGDEPGGTPKMVLTTAKSMGSTIQLYIKAEAGDQADVWIDLNNNGKKDTGEQVTSFGNHINYKIASKTVAIYGKVKELECLHNELTALDVSDNVHLENLNCQENSLATLDLSANTNLTVLYCGDNDLTRLIFSNNPKIYYLLCTRNKLKEIDLSSLTALEQLYCSENQLTTLDVTNCHGLERLICRRNKISGAGMDKLVNSLPNRQGKEKGYFGVIDTKSPVEENTITAAQVAIAKAKNWPPLQQNGYDYPGS